MTRETTSRLNAAWSALMVEEFLRQGVDRFFAAPGARCAPLLHALATEGRMRGARHFDERGLGFAALGAARRTGRPALVVTTSGTAVANLLPAVIEAARTDTPMVLLTADRPPELRDVGANQAITQPGIFGSYVRWCVDLPCPDAAIDPAYVLTTVDEAVFRARRGPVHINCMFREPLNPPEDAGKDRSIESRLPVRWQKTCEPYTVHTPDGCDHSGLLERVAGRLKEVQSGVILIGPLRLGANTEWVAALSRVTGFPVIADAASQVWHPSLGSVCAPWFDLIADTSAGRRVAEVEVVLQLGGRMTSKRLCEEKTFPAEAEWIRVGPDQNRLDPVHCGGLRVVAEVPEFCSALVSVLAKPLREFPSGWEELVAGVSSALADELNRYHELTEPGVLRSVWERTPETDILFLGNSMPVRDGCTVAFPRRGMPAVATNRGASGIDGNLATCAGLADFGVSGITAVLGDLALLHDLNSLALLRAQAESATVVVLNNRGGGIFSFLPLATREHSVSQWFTAPHEFEFEAAARQFGFEYVRPRDPAALVRALEEAGESKGHIVIEVRTDRAENVRVHSELRAAVRRAVGE